jgi:RecA-family ATPase
VTATSGDMSTIRDGAWLDSQVFPEPSWCVPGIISEGCCIMSGHPKIGKSFLVLAIALAAASGGTVLGVAVEARPVLYMALEDDPRRLQVRSRILLDDEPLPSGFSFLTRYDTEGAIDVARSWVESHRDEKPLVIVDTLEKIRGGRTQSAYSDDYKAGTLLQSLLAKGGAVIAVHHNRKGDSEDFLDQVSGTLGLAGSVDTIITLNRQRTGTSGTLSVTGRDVDEMVYKLNFVGGHWSTDGGDLQEAARRTTTRKFGAKMQEALELVKSGMATTIGEVAEYLDVSDGTARKYLSRLASDYGLIERTGNGRYGPVTVSQLSQDAPTSEDVLTSA